VSAAIVGRHDLDVLTLPAAVRLLILDPDVREVDLVVEVRQVVFVRPFANLIGRAIGVAVVVVAILVALVQPSLVLAFQFMIKDHALDVRSAFPEARLGVLEGAIDLEVVFELTLAFQPRVERLRVPPIRVAVALEKTAPGLRQTYRVVAVSRQALDVDQPLFTQVTEVARTRVGATAVVVAKITTGDHSERADCRERARVRPA